MREKAWRSRKRGASRSDTRAARQAFERMHILWLIGMFLIGWVGHICTSIADLVYHLGGPAVCTRACYSLFICVAACMLQLYRLLYNCAKTGGKSAVVAMCDAGVVKAFANLARAPHHPEFVWDSEVVMPVVMLLKLLTSADQRRVADLGSQGAMQLAFAAGVAFTLASDKKLVEIGA